MKVVIQKSKEASISVNNKIINKIKSGLVILVGFTQDDTIEDINYLVKKIINLRIFNDENGVMNKSILEVGGDILSISQFTLYANTKKGNRPSYIKALNGKDAINLYNKFNEELNKQIKTYPGIFGENMQINLINDGPTTIIIDTKE